MITGRQIKAARALLDWDAEDLAKAAGLSRDTVFNIENGKVQARGGSAEKIVQAFVDNGLEFVGERGVALRETNIGRFRGPHAITDLLEDVYETVKNGGEICISSCDEDMVEKFYAVRGERHSVRMARIADKISCRALLKEGDTNYPYTSYVEYRWMPKEYFKPNTFYVYNNKIGLIEYKGSICEVTIIESAQLATAFRDIFDIVWAQCQAPPDKRKSK